MRLIDVDDAIEKINCLCVDDNENWIGTENQSFVDNADVIDILSSIPTVDAVAVVRCKDCKQWRRNIGFTDSPNGHCFYHDIDTNGLDFCSYGERRDSDV